PVNRGFADLRVEPLHHVAELEGYPSRSASVGGVAAPRGFEPRFTDPKSAVLPLDEGASPSARIRPWTRATASRVLEQGVWSGRRDSNPRPSPWQGDALPTEPLPLGTLHLERWCRGPGSNWRHRDFQSRALPTELPRPDGQPCRLPVGGPQDTTGFRDGVSERRVPDSPTPAPPARPTRSCRAAGRRSARAAG